MGSTNREAAGTIRASDIVQFTPKQKVAFDATFTHRFLMYGGARGGGKSYLLRNWLLLFLIYQYMQYGISGVRVGLFCKTYPELRDRQISKIKKEFPMVLGDLKSTQEDGLGFYLHEEYGGGGIWLRNLDDPSKYQSAEFAAIGVDELTKISLNDFNVLRGSLRWTGIPQTVFMGATNPGGPGHLWCKNYWIDRIYPPEMQDMKHQFKFIQSLPMDNPYLDQQYWDDLNSLPPDLQRAWVEGDWNVFAGQAFSTFRNDRHVCEPFRIPDHWRKWRAIDWGFAAPWVCLWIAKDPATGRHYVYRESVATGLTDVIQAKTIMELSNEYVEITYADPSMWAKKNVKDVVTSTFQEYAKVGVPLTKADNDRLSGKRKVDRLLEDLPDGEPGLKIFSTCSYLISTLPALPYDETRIEDVDTDADDHGYDALKYGLTAVRSEPNKPAQKKIPRAPLQGVSQL